VFCVVCFFSVVLSLCNLCFWFVFCPYFPAWTDVNGRCAVKKLLANSLTHLLGQHLRVELINPTSVSIRPFTSRVVLHNWMKFAVLCRWVICGMIWSKVKVTDVSNVWKWPISTSTSVHVIKRLTANYDTPRQYLNFNLTDFLIFILVRCHVTFKLKAFHLTVRGVDQQSRTVLICVCVCVCDWRRIRELNENNMKKYIDERRRQQGAQTRQMELLRKAHQEQFDKLNQEMDRVSSWSYYLLDMLTLWRPLLPYGTMGTAIKQTRLNHHL